MELDRSSTSAAHWAEQFCKTVEEHNLNVDPDLLAGWFANYWAAVHDPLQTKIDKLEEAVHSVRVEAIGWAYADACVHLDKGEDYRKVEVPTILDRALKDLE